MVVSRPTWRCGANVSCLTDKGGLYFTGVWSDGSPAATRSRAKVGYSLGEYLDRGFRKVALAFHGTLDLRKASVGRTIFRQNPILLKRWGFRLRPVAVRNANNLHRDASCNARKTYGIPPAGDSSTVWKRKGGNDRPFPSSSVSRQVFTQESREAGGMPMRKVHFGPTTPLSVTRAGMRLAANGKGAKRASSRGRIP
jgi:hypothetical protein